MRRIEEAFSRAAKRSALVSNLTRVGRSESASINTVLDVDEEKRNVFSEWNYKS
jgi:hypothetical protein